MDTLPHSHLAKVDNDRELEIREPQVGEGLRFEYSVVRDRGLALDDDSLAYEQIEAQVRRKTLALYTSGTIFWRTTLSPRDSSSKASASS